MVVCRSGCPWFDRARRRPDRLHARSPAGRPGEFIVVSFYPSGNFGESCPEVRLSS